MEKDSITRRGEYGVYICVLSKVYHYAALAVAISLIFHNIVTVLYSHSSSRRRLGEIWSGVEKENF